jgi:hypothetical protein
MKIAPGQVYSDLTVLKVLPNKKCTCRCACGNTKDILTRHIRSGLTRSCGCWSRRYRPRPDIRKSFGESSFNCFFYSTKHAASSRGFAFELSKEQVKTLAESSCFYCGRSQVQSTFSEGSFGAFNHVGIDRVDNTKGYTVENSVPCCKDCNRMKGSLSLGSFMEWVLKVKHFGR